MQYLKISNKNFNLFYNVLDREYAKAVAKHVENSFNRIATDFSLPDYAEKYDFYICPSVDSYIQLTNKTAESYEDWMVGWADYRIRRICILSARIVKDKTLDEMDRVITHEIIHIAFDSLNAVDAVAPWMAEGVATLYANQIDLDFVDIENFPLIKDLSEEDSFINNGGYDYCGIYVWYFLKKYGIDSFKNIYMGNEVIDKFLYLGFEQEALESFINCPDNITCRHSN